MQFGLPGGPELLIILFIAVLLFGANKLPKLARASGEAMGEFKRGRQELEDEIKRGAAESTESGSPEAEPTLEAEAADADPVETTERPGETDVPS
ncbi:MAG: twin-arginine translocase TatA/TatE family subunit [Natronomonas sp.]|jgi:sec-independent protein translocase protein TatA|nr:MULTISPECIES: twin-arginine translocase TatA/TatE family subunit [Natronomonas]MDR9380748.1 twin-arginine translocase TatA/TatE family subunit [Natronomonas sp.]MDR9429766.1 twin-arginine translocase TatA/TatE family subunit [Natronomonas sp.]